MILTHIYKKNSIIENKAVPRTTFIPQAPAVQKVDSAIHHLNLYPVDRVIIANFWFPLFLSTA